MSQLKGKNTNLELTYLKKMCLNVSSRAVPSTQKINTYEYKYKNTYSNKHKCKCISTWGSREYNYNCKFAILFVHARKYKQYL